MISAILLAAGESRRMGRPKQLLPWRGKTLLQHCLETVLRSDADEVVLVLGYKADMIRKRLPPLPVKIVTNQDFNLGMAASLRCGLLAMDPGSEAFLVFLADQPGIAPETVNTLIRRFRQADPKRGIVRPVYRGQGGHPVLIAARYLQEALQLQGDEGARRILLNHPGDILEVPLDHDAVLKDIDTPDQYRAYGDGSGPDGS